MGQRGVTLLELMITVVVVAILAAVAVPSYFSYVRDSRRDLAKQSLLAAAQKMESYYALNMKYSESASNGSPTIFSDKVPADGSERYYTLTVSASQSSYTLSAVPQGSQSSDSCGTLSLTRAGAKTPSTSGCW
ncbi:MAG: prepilin-type N-terminal cleavage/methylation domain-containing protein [Aeromonadaceae bacterium]|nr:prepilin-type N-terminal cleavage/methylation domain-containing protein [Aeromonadaceae bacterium]